MLNMFVCVIKCGVLIWEAVVYVGFIYLFVLFASNPSGCGKWLPLPQSGSAGGIFLLEGSFSFSLSPSSLIVYMWN